MTKYREIIRLHCMGYSKRNIALSVPCSRNTAARVADRADELQFKWPLSHGLSILERAQKVNAYLPDGRADMRLLFCGFGGWSA